MSTLRYEKADLYPRVTRTNSVGDEMLVVDVEEGHLGVRVGVSSYESTRAEVVGHAETETAKMRIPMKWKGRPLTNISVGAIVVWDGSEWDVAIPPKIRRTRTHSVRHYTIEIKRRPFGANLIPEVP